MVHGAENTEHELRKAYNCVIETAVTHHWDRQGIPGVNSDEVSHLYKLAFQNFRKGHRLAAERWARTAKHLARAFWHEAKIRYLEPRTADFPYLPGASGEDLNLHETIITTTDLLDSLAEDLPPGLTTFPEDMKHYLSRGRKHLEILKDKEYKNELLRAERIKAAHEYGRVLECIALAYEAEGPAASAA